MSSSLDPLNALYDAAVLARDGTGIPDDPNGAEGSCAPPYERAGPSDERAKRYKAVSTSTTPVQVFDIARVMPIGSFVDEEMTEPFDWRRFVDKTNTELYRHVRCAEVKTSGSYFEQMHEFAPFRLPTRNKCLMNIQSTYLESVRRIKMKYDEISQKHLVRDFCARIGDQCEPGIVEKILKMAGEHLHARLIFCHLRRAVNLHQACTEELNKTWYATSDNYNHLGLPDAHRFAAGVRTRRHGIVGCAIDTQNMLAPGFGDGVLFKLTYMPLLIASNPLEFVHPFEHDHGKLASEPATFLGNVDMPNYASAYALLKWVRRHAVHAGDELRFDMTSDPAQFEFDLATEGAVPPWACQLVVSLIPTLDDDQPAAVHIPPNADGFQQLYANEVLIEDDESELIEVDENYDPATHGVLPEGVVLEEAVDVATGMHVLVPYLETPPDSDIDNDDDSDYTE